MDILIPDKWLRQFLKTKADKSQIAKYLSLAGPSVERIKKTPLGPVYAMEITTNRVDMAGVYGIAREAAAILPRFKIPAKLLPLITQSQGKFVKKVSYLKADVDAQLCPRFTAVLIKGVKVKPSPLTIQQELKAVGLRPINNVVDISNYLMHELGQPVHTFDYDKVSSQKMTLRASRRGEKITTLDGQTLKLTGGDIVIEDGLGRLIDLAGIMGGENSAVDPKTQNVLLFVQNYAPAPIRKTSMTLAKRTEASSLFEKGLDPCLVEPTLRQGIDLFQKLTGGKAEKEILDIYLHPYKPKNINLAKSFIESRLGITLSKSEIAQALKPLGFGVAWQGQNLSVTVPSWRARDMAIPEDIVEEVARIKGYAQLPSKLMTGAIPVQYQQTPFEFEAKVKNLLKVLGGVEVYTLSLVSESQAGPNALKLKNPLGSESAYLRTQMLPSLRAAAKDNAQGQEKFHLWEIANVYTPRKNDLPQEKMVLAGIFFNYPFRKAKGIIEALLQELNLDCQIAIEDKNGYLQNQRIIFKKDSEILGEFGVLDDNFTCYEFGLEKLKKFAQETRAFKPVLKYPAQIEDLTLIFPQKTKMSDVLDFLKKVHPEVRDASLENIYRDAFTFKIWYQNPAKTLTNQEVEKIRKTVLVKLQQKFGAAIKD